MGMIKGMIIATRQREGTLHPVHVARARGAHWNPYGGRMVARRPLGDPGLLSGISGLLHSAVSMVPGGSIINKIVPSPQAIHNFFNKHKTGIAGAAGALGAAGAVGLANLAKGRGGSVSGATGVRRKYRRMNPLNYRALKRSSRRIHQAAKIMRTVFAQAKHVRVPKRQPKGVRGYRRRAA